MSQIWKFELGPSAEVEMPVGAEILSVKVQRGRACMWALVDTLAKTEIRKFELVGTGCTIPEDMNLRFIDTFMMEEETFVLHLFEVMNE